MAGGSGFTLGQELGHGRTFQVTLTPGVRGAAAAPAAGASYSYVTGPWDWMRLVFCAFTFTSSNVAANRYITVEYPDGAGVGVLADAAPVVVTASTSNQRFIGSFKRASSEWNASTDVFFPLSGIWLEAGRTITINVANIDVGDALTKIRLTFDATPVHEDGSELVRGMERARDVEAYERAIAAAMSS